MLKKGNRAIMEVLIKWHGATTEDATFKKFDRLMEKFPNANIEDKVSMASISSHDLIIHYMDKVFTIMKVDSNRYNYMDMFIDVCEVALRNQPSNVGMLLTMHCAIFGSNDFMDVTSTADVLQMFELYQRVNDIHIFLKASDIEGGGQESKDGLSDYQSNDDCDPISNSDSNDKGVDINRFMCGKEFEVQEGRKVSLEVGMLFGNVTEFREALRDYVIQEGFEIVKDKNEKTRVTVHCSAEGCLWRIHASPLPDGVTYKIKTFLFEHTYDGIRSEIRETYEIEPSNMQLYRARVKARDEIEGNHDKSYGKLPIYAEMVRETNSDSLVKIQYDRISLSVNPTFKRFFICFEAMKSGFLEGCRPFIGLDGCHLKGPYGGVLLAAIALDGNNGLFPVAFAVVEGETKESWSFFLYYLRTINGTTTHQRPLCFMTDRQKGVVEAINEITPEATHRVCSYNNRVFTFAMDKMKRDKKEGYEWLMEIPMHSWSRHAFDPRVRSEHVTNNMTESFNQWVGDLRGKPILTLVDSIRVKLMSSIHRRYEKACAWESLVTPKIRRKLDAIKHDSRMGVVVFAGNEEYEVIEGFTTFVVNLHDKSCICQAWEISGLPCKHAVACIQRKRANLEEYCDEYYSKETYLRAHGGIVHPIPDESMWPPRNHDPVEPPSLLHLPGRPK
ncbi:hypothetical protein HHK36_025919 [Tetracentron sinense]|uniref:SWIM-type domain-containing protein n=1 Tax=Tetracentron sinense TaxID=13715 RepID=A0A834YP51_TETSI|nr:hypothetical protein HHK36_025919 [Tetracentron sinense]